MSTQTHPSGYTLQNLIIHVIRLHRLTDAAHMTVLCVLWWARKHRSWWIRTISDSCTVLMFRGINSSGNVSLEKPTQRQTAPDNRAICSEIKKKNNVTSNSESTEWNHLETFGCFVAAESDTKPAIKQWQAIMTDFNMYIFSSVLLALKLQEWCCWLGCRRSVPTTRLHHFCVRNGTFWISDKRFLQRLANPW